MDHASVLSIDGQDGIIHLKTDGRFVAPDAENSNKAADLTPSAAFPHGCKGTWDTTQPQFTGHRRSPSEYSDVSVSTCTSSGSSWSVSPDMHFDDQFEPIEQFMIQPCLLVSQHAYNCPLGSFDVLHLNNNTLTTKSSKGSTHLFSATPKTPSDPFPLSIVDPGILNNPDPRAQLKVEVAQVTIHQEVIDRTNSRTTRSSSGTSGSPDWSHCEKQSELNAKSSPFSTGESESSADNESDFSEDETDSLEACESDGLEFNFQFNPWKKHLVKEIMQNFWEIFNRDSAIIVSASGESPGTSRTQGSIPQRANSSIQPSNTVKRQREEDDNLPPNDNNDRSPKRPRPDSSIILEDKISSKFACPFRKHNPRKYNIHQHKTCALSSFESVARLKEHIYRKHRAPIQCVRCWLFFKDQIGLDSHLSVVNVCTLRPGEPTEGINLDMEKRLRSKKKTSPYQTEEDRWKDIYRMLFPNEEVPSPIYEPVQDDASQSPEPSQIPIEEFMRQEVPNIFRRRLEVEVNELEDATPSTRGALRDGFLDRMTDMVKDAQTEALSDYKSKTGQPSLLITPPPSLTATSIKDGQIHVLSEPFLPPHNGGQQPNWRSHSRSRNTSADSGYAGSDMTSQSGSSSQPRDFEWPFKFDTNSDPQAVCVTTLDHQDGRFVLQNTDFLSSATDTSIGDNRKEFGHLDLGWNDFDLSAESLNLADLFD